MPEETGSKGAFSWWTELIATLLLGLAAVGAGWSAYQSALWNSESFFSIVRAGAMFRQAGLVQNKGYLLRVLDVGMFTAYAQAVSQKNTPLAEFILKRFRPPMKAAVDAWLATKPLQNPNAPSSPFAMTEYRLPEDEEAQQLTIKADRDLTNGKEYNRVSDDYVLITVPFAIVSLFCGLSTKFPTRGMQTAIVAMALAFFIGAVATLASMPVTR
jgi:hypothetical protein